jgi:hypothetical protein
MLWAIVVVALLRAWLAVMIAPVALPRASDRPTSQPLRTPPELPRRAFFPFASARHQSRARVAALNERGFAPLIDRTEIYDFEDWWKRIQALIVQADTIIFVLSPESVSYDICRQEVAFAASLNKRFAPIVCRRVDPAAVPTELSRLNLLSAGPYSPRCAYLRLTKRRHWLAVGVVVNRICERPCADNLTKEERS